MHSELARNSEGRNRACHSAFNNRHMIIVVRLVNQRISKVGQLERIEETTRIARHQAEDTG